VPEYIDTIKVTLKTKVVRFMLGTSRESVEKAFIRPGLERKPERSDFRRRVVDLPRENGNPSIEIIVSKI